MKRYLMKKLATYAVVLLGISVIVFTVLLLMPGDPYSSMLLDPTIPEEYVYRKLEELGYYDPIPAQYVKWLGRVFQGDLGYSTQYELPTLGLLTEALENTLLLTLSAFLVSTVLAVSLGVCSALRPNGALDRAVTFLTFVETSIPTFFFALILIKFLSYDLGVFPASGMLSLRNNYTGLARVADLLRHMALPVIVLVITQTSGLLRYTRSAVMDVLRQDYIRTAQAKGLTRNGAVRRHGLHNSLLPIINVVCMRIPSLFSGALITEVIFVWPGIGTLNYNAIMNRDYAVVMSVTMMVSVLVLATNLLADILCFCADPRIRRGA